MELKGHAPGSYLVRKSDENYRLSVVGDDNVSLGNENKNIDEYVLECSSFCGYFLVWFIQSWRNKLLFLRIHYILLLDGRKSVVS